MVSSLPPPVKIQRGKAKRKRDEYHGSQQERTPLRLAILAIHRRPVADARAQGDGHNEKDQSSHGKHGRHGQDSQNNRSEFSC